MGMPATSRTAGAQIRGVGAFSPSLGVGRCASAFARSLAAALPCAACLAVGRPVGATRRNAPSQRSRKCGRIVPGLVADDRPRMTPASFRLAALNADQVRLTFIGHATFLIESPQLVRIATDYNDYLKPPVLPDIVTMNHAHDTHLHRPSRSGDQIRAARLGAEPGRAGDLGSEISRRAGAQRADQYPQLGAAAPSATAIRSSFSRSRICASRISAICITR